MCTIMCARKASVLLVDSAHSMHYAYRHTGLVLSAHAHNNGLVKVVNNASWLVVIRRLECKAPLNQIPSLDLMQREIQ